MSSAEASPVRRERRDSGYTMAEVMVAIGLIAMMSIALNYAIQSTQSADQQLETANRAALHGQRLTNEIANLVSASRQIFQDDVLGAGYLAACDLSRFPPAPDSRMPRIDDENDLGPDAADMPHTGNLLLLLRETSGSPCVADRFSGKTWIIDTYRLTAIYPHVTGRTVMQGGPPARDVVVWHSEAFPSLQQIMEIPSEDERESVVQDLVKRYGFTYAWDPRLDVSQAFYVINKKGEVADNPAMNVDIVEEPLLSRGPRLTYADVQLAPTDPDRFVRRAVLTADELGGWRPQGLEIKVTGGSMARKVWIHTVVEAAWQGGLKQTVHTCTTIADAREY